MGNIPRNTSRRNKHRATIRAQQPNCHICGGPINWTAHRDEPDSFVVDHIIPLSKGGPDTLENKAAAHRSCNSKKRARKFAPIIRRSGALD